MTDDSKAAEETTDPQDVDEEQEKDPAISMTSKQRQATHAKKQRALEKQRAKEAEPIDWEGDVSQENLDSLPSANDIRAVAANRGYPIPAGGRKRVTAAFLHHQSQDPLID